MKKYLYFSLIICLFGCIKEYVSLTSSFINNTTVHTIKIQPYWGNILDSSNFKTIPPNSKINVFNLTVRGKTLEPSFAVMLQPYDSVLVTFDDTIKIPHIRFNIKYNGSHKILYTDDRSISNNKNWLKEITEESKHSLTGNFTYTFVEQDYLDAK